MAAYSGKSLADLSHRLAVATEAGVDVRKVWQREAANAPAGSRTAIQRIAAHVKGGGTIADALSETGDTFPELWRDMVGIGETTGHLPEVFHRLSDHYQFQHDLFRNFLRLITWPLLQLIAAVGIVGIMILIMGIIPGDADPLGLGLRGVSGFFIYMFVVALVLGAAVTAIAAVRKGALWGKWLQIKLTSLYGIGDAVQKICLARIAWALHLTLNVEMDLRELIPAVLRASGNEYYTQHTERMTREVGSGQGLYETFLHTKAFPPTFLDALQVAEESGQISESMARLASTYEGEARRALQTLATAAFVAVWVMVGAIIISVIFRIFMFYLNTLNEALEF